MNDMNLVLFFINVFDIVLIAFFLAVTPMITRKNLLFGVRITEEASSLPEVKKLKRNYILRILAAVLIIALLCILQYVWVPRYSLLMCILAPLILMPLQMLVFVPHWKAATKLKKEKGWQTSSASVVDTRSSVERMRFSAIPWGWYIASVVLILISVIWSIVVYKNLPDRIVTHWDISGNADDWDTKSLSTVFMAPLIGLLTVGIMVVSNISIFRTKLQINQDNPQLSFAQHREYRKMMSQMLGIVTLCCGVLFAFIQMQIIEVLPNNPSLINTVIIGLCVVIIVPTSYIPFKAGQSGCKLKPRVDEEHPLAASGNVRTIHPGQGDDRYWKLGMFYYNPDDPAILVEDRFGGNSGFNYARPVARLIVACLALVVVATVVVTAIASLQM